MTMCERNRLDSCQCQILILQVKDSDNDNNTILVSFHEKEILQMNWWSIETGRTSTHWKECELRYAGRCELRKSESQNRYWKKGELSSTSSRRHTMEKKTWQSVQPLLQVTSWFGIRDHLSGARIRKKAIMNNDTDAKATFWGTHSYRQVRSWEL